MGDIDKLCTALPRFNSSCLDGTSVRGLDELIPDRVSAEMAVLKLRNHTFRERYGAIRIRRERTRIAWKGRSGFAPGAPGNSWQTTAIRGLK